MVDRYGQIVERLKLNERKRNERRLRILREALDHDRSQHPVDLMVDENDSGNVVPLGGRREADEADPFDLTG
jgi:hypothetical protein